MMVGGDVKSHDSSFLRARKKMTLCNIYETRASGKEVALASTPLTYTLPACTPHHSKN